MARYRGPRLRILRRHNTELPGLTSKVPRRAWPPGHAAALTKRAPKLTEHGTRLREKQKLRYHYGLHERQLRLVYEKASRMAGDTSHNMMSLLESRLDNLVWRAGLARTLPAARQLVTHGHVMVNGRRAKTPSQFIGQGDTIALRQNCLAREDIRLSVNSPTLERPSGLNMDLDKLSIKIDTLPSWDSSPLSVDIQKVVEFYAR